MAYLVDTKTDKEQMVQPMGCHEAFTPEQVARADRLEIWGSSFEDPGEDWCEYRLLNGDKLLVAKRYPGF